MLSLQSIDRRNPINWRHPLNRDLAVRFLALPGLDGGSWHDLCGFETGVLQGVNFANGVRSPSGGTPIYFPGTTNDLVTVTPSYGRTITSFTFGCWLLPENAGCVWAVGPGGGLGQQNGIGCGNYTYTYQGTYLNGAAWINNGANIVSPYNGTPDGWIRLVVTMNVSNNTVTWYYNGYQVGGTTGYAPLAILTNSYPLYIGGQNGGDPLQGYIDDFFIVNRIWTADEVARDNILARTGYPGLFNTRMFPPTGGNGGTGGGGNTSPFLTITPLNQLPYYDILQSARSSIILPAPNFGNQVVGQNKINLYKVMTRAAYTYIQSTSRVDVKMEYTLDRIKSLELRNFVMANISQPMYYIGANGKTYYGQFGNNPIEMNTDRKYGPGNEAVIVSLEFQGVLYSTSTAQAQ